jgi:hypothetical protein
MPSGLDSLPHAAMIEVINRKAYSFHDLRYFSLKIYQAFYN